MRRARFSPETHRAPGPFRGSLARAVGLLVGLVASTATLLGGGPPAAAAVAPRTTAPFPQPTWVDTVGPVAMSSPTVATINGEEDVVFGTESGYVYVVDAATGQNVPGWPQPVEPDPGVPTAVESSPTVAYLDGPNRPPSIIVGAGSTYVADQQGGLVAFNANGTIRFRFATQDVFNEWSSSQGTPDGYDEAVFTTPAIGDVTGDGQEDIVFGSWDHRLYALTPSGHLVPGFPVDTEDTIWSSPALFHLRGSANAEDILIGGDASGKQGCSGGFVYDFTYRDQAPHLVWQHCENQTIWSSPAVGVINATGRPAVVVGTGFGEPPPYKSDTNKVFAFYASDGAPVPGWPVTTAGPVFGSPAIGTLPGSTTPAVVDTSWCTSCSSTPTGSSMVYAWSGTGTLLWSQTLVGPNDFSSPVLVDLTGSGANDVLVGSAGGLYPLDGGDGRVPLRHLADRSDQPLLDAERRGGRRRAGKRTRRGLARLRVLRRPEGGRRYGAPDRLPAAGDARDRPAVAHLARRPRPRRVGGVHAAGDHAEHPAPAGPPGGEAPHPVAPAPQQRRLTPPGMRSASTPTELAPSRACAAPGWRRRRLLGGRARRQLRAVDDLVDEAVLAGLLGREPTVAVRVGLDPLDRLAGVEGDPLGHHPLQVDDLLGLDGDVRRLALHLAGGLVHQDPRVRQRVALAGGPGAEQELAHRGGEAEADRRDVAADVLHRVVDREAVGHRAAGRVDVERDVPVGSSASSRSSWAQIRFAEVWSTWVPRKTIRSFNRRW